MLITNSKRAVKRLWALRGALAILDDNTLTVIGPPKALTTVNLSNPLDLGLDQAIEHGPVLTIEQDGLLKLKWHIY